MKSNAVSPARLAAFEILRRVEEGAYASILLSSKEDELSPRDRALVHELVLGVLRQQLFLDRLIEHFADRKTETLDLAVKLALRLGLYQLRFLSRIPPSAAVNESVNLVRRARLRSAEGLVNAVLRRGTREPNYDPVASVGDPHERLSVETSHPEWLIRRWVEAFGFDFICEFARANNIAPPLAFRIVRNRANESVVTNYLQAGGAHMRRSRLAEGAWLLEGSARPLLDLATAGKVYIQDEASQLVGEILRVRPGERFLDVCAAPGSKTTQVADQEDQARVVAADSNETRLRTVGKTAELQGLSNISRLVMNGLQQFPLADNCFDVVLVDAPCSGTGTLRRNPEIRWRITAADIHDLAARQKELLTQAARALKPDGRLVYSTCSVEPEENEEVVKQFLELNPDFVRVSAGVERHLITASGAVRTWPHRDGADGFFAVVLKRQSTREV